MTDDIMDLTPRQEKYLHDTFFHIQRYRPEWSQAQCLLEFVAQFNQDCPFTLIEKVSARQNELAQGIE